LCIFMTYYLALTYTVTTTTVSLRDEARDLSFYYFCTLIFTIN